MAQLEDCISTLAGISERLNDAANRVTESIQHWESQVSKTGVGIEHWLSDHSELPVWEHNVTTGKSSEEDDEAEVWGYDIGWAKVDGKWRFAYRAVKGRKYREIDVTSGSVLFDRVEAKEAKPLVNSPRPVRWRAIGALASIIEGLSWGANEELTRLERQLEVLAGSAAPGETL